MWKLILYGNLVLNAENDVNVMVYLLLVRCMLIKREIMETHVVMSLLGWHICSN